jgi:polar amino acid transport system substrate-binding protein
VTSHNASGRFGFVIATVVSFLTLAAAEPVSAQQTVKVGYAPFTLPLSWLPGATLDNYRTLDPNTVQGAMIELYKAVAKDGGFQIQFVSMVSGELPEAQNSGRIDLRIVDASAENKAAMPITAPIYNDSEVLIAHKSDTIEYKSYGDLRGQVIGSRTGAIYEDDLRKAGLQIKSYAAVPELFGAVNSGEIRVAINTTYLATAYTLLQGQYPNIKIVKTYQVKFPRLAGIGGRKEHSELIRKADAFLVQKKLDGTVKEIFSKYGIADTLVK